jgi:midasin (ATPase involved in ribosome maturation)
VNFTVRKFSNESVHSSYQIKERNGINKSTDAVLPGLDDWKAFGERAELFERQRLACDCGLAFAFTEGALVDAIRTGKW